MGDGQPDLGVHQLGAIPLRVVLGQRQKPVRAAQRALAQAAAFAARLAPVCVARDNRCVSVSGELFSEERSGDVVAASFDGTPDPRLREVLHSLVRHLHAFVKDVELTEAEWAQAIAFLTATGQ